MKAFLIKYLPSLQSNLRRICKSENRRLLSSPSQKGCLSQKDFAGRDKRDVEEIVIVGCGAVGLLYGCRLLEGEISVKRKMPLNLRHAVFDNQNEPTNKFASSIGLPYNLDGRRSKLSQNIRFLFRSGHQRARKSGILIKSPDGDYFASPDDLKGKVYVNSERIIEDIVNQSDTNVVDFGSSATNDKTGVTHVNWVICAFKSYALIDNEHSVRSLLSPLIGPDTRILVLMNGYGTEKVFANWFGASRVFGGMAFICVNRVNNQHVSEEDSPILIDHIAFGALHIGHCLDDARELAVARALWDDTKLQPTITIAESLLYSRWSKLCWNLPFNGIAVALGGITTDVIARDCSLRELASKVMIDTISLANADIAYHHQLSSDYDQHLNKNLDSTNGSEISTIRKLTLFDAEAIQDMCWKLTDSMGPYKSSTVIDLVNGNEMEIEYIFNKPFQRTLYLSSKDASKSSCQQEEGPYLFNETTRISFGPSNAHLLPKKNIHRNISQKWPYLESIVLQVQSIQNIAAARRKIGIKWNPTMLN